MIKAIAKTVETIAVANSPSPHLELVCPVRNLSGLRMAIDNGADCVRIDYPSVPEELRCPELKPDTGSLKQGVEYAHKRGRKAVLGLDIQSQPAIWADLRNVIDRAVQSGIDALVLSDPALILYTAMRHPGLAVHYRPPIAILNNNAVELIRAQLGVSRIVLPNAVSLKQLQTISGNTTVEIEIASVALNAPTHHTLAAESNEGFDADLSDYRISLCASGEDASNEPCYDRSQILEGTVKLLPQLAAIGVRAVTAEACSPELRHLAGMTRMWRDAIDHCFQDHTL